MAGTAFSFCCFGFFEALVIFLGVSFSGVFVVFFLDGGRPLVESSFFCFGVRLFEGKVVVFGEGEYFFGAPRVRGPLTMRDEGAMVVVFLW